MEMTPRNVDFGAIPRAAATQYQTVTLLRSEGGPIAPTLVPSKRSVVDSQICEIEPGERYELVLSLSPPWPTRQFRERLEIETGLEGAPKQAIRVVGSIKPRLAAIPNRFLFSENQEQETELDVRLEWDDNKPVNILDVTCSYPGATVALDDSGDTQKIRLTMPAGSKRIPGTHRVTIKTGDPEASTLEVPVSFRQKRPRGAAAARRAPPPGRRTGTSGAKPTKID